MSGGNRSCWRCWTVAQVSLVVRCSEFGIMCLPPWCMKPEELEKLRRREGENVGNAEVLVPQGSRAAGM